jgi:excisionase family DNA binding protein
VRRCAVPNDTGERLALRPPEAAKLLGISISHLAKLTAQGRIPRVKLGLRCTLYRREDLAAWLEQSATRVPQ